MALVLDHLDMRPDGVAHLDEVSLVFEPGRLYTVLGRTMAGKTTLLRTIAGLQKPDRGNLTLNGEDFLNLPVWKRRVAMVYQQFINYPHLNVLDNVAFPLRRAGVGRDEARRRAGEVLAKVGLTELESRRPSALSGGQQQRVALARALVKKAEILLMDEPLVNLDYKLREQLREEFQNIFQGQNEAIVIYTTTEPAEAIQLGHEMIILDEGAVIQQGDPLAVFKSPASIRCAEIINDPPMNIFEGEIEAGEINFRGGVSLDLPDHLKGLSRGSYRFGLRAVDVRMDGGVGCQVELSEISGSQTTLYLKGSIGEFILHEEGVCQYPLGSAVRVDLQADRIFCFAMDGELLSAPASTATYRS